MILLKIISNGVNHLILFCDKLFIFVKYFELVYLWKLNKLVMFLVIFISFIMDLPLSLRQYVRILVLIIFMVEVLVNDTTTLLMFIIFLLGFHMISKKHSLMSSFFTLFCSFMLRLLSYHRS
jgi:hypothetical protein